MAIKLKITDGPNLAFQVSSITLNAGAGNGNFPALDNLDGKAVVVAADLALTGDSANSFANKESTWQQIIDSVLSGIWQPLSTALSKITESGGLPLWDGGAWPGGGGAEWDNIGPPVIAVSAPFVTYQGLDNTYKEYRTKGFELFPTGTLRAQLEDSGVFRTTNYAWSITAKNKAAAITWSSNDSSIKLTSGWSSNLTDSPVDIRLLGPGNSGKFKLVRCETETYFGDAPMLYKSGGYGTFNTSPVTGIRLIGPITGIFQLQGRN